MASLLSLPTEIYQTYLLQYITDSRDLSSLVSSCRHLQFVFGKDLVHVRDAKRWRDYDPRWDPETGRDDQRLYDQRLEDRPTLLLAIDRRVDEDILAWIIEIFKREYPGCNSPSRYISLTLYLWHPVHLAVYRNNLPAVKLLLAHGFPLDEEREPRWRNSLGERCLTWFDPLERCLGQNVMLLEMVEALLAAGHCITHRHLKIAAANMQPKALKLLMDATEGQWRDLGEGIYSILQSALRSRRDGNEAVLDLLAEEKGYYFPFEFYDAHLQTSFPVGYAMKVGRYENALYLVRKKCGLDLWMVVEQIVDRYFKHNVERRSLDECPGYMFLKEIHPELTASTTGMACSLGLACRMGCQDRVPKDLSDREKTFREGCKLILGKVLGYLSPSDEVSQYLLRTGCAIDADMLLTELESWCLPSYRLTPDIQDFWDEPEGFFDLLEFQRPFRLAVYDNFRCGNKALEERLERLDDFVRHGAPLNSKGEINPFKRVRVLDNWPRYSEPFDSMDEIEKDDDESILHTPLDYAVSHGFWPAVYRLLHHGADPSRLNAASRSSIRKLRGTILAMFSDADADEEGDAWLLLEDAREGRFIPDMAVFSRDFHDAKFSQGLTLIMLSVGLTG